MTSSKNDFWVGLFVLIGGAAILFLALQSANLLSLNFEKTYQVGTIAKGPNVRALPVADVGVEGDCRPTRAYQKDDGSWYALLDGRWVAVPPKTVLNELAPDGRSHISNVAPLLDAVWSALNRSVASVCASGSSLFGSSGGWPPFGEASVISAPASFST